MDTPAKIVLADAHYLIRIGLKNLLQRDLRFRLVGEAREEAELLQLVKQTRPDLVVFDPAQTEHFSLSVLDHILEASPNTRLVVITASNHRSFVYQVMERGVSCVLTKECEDREILDALEAAHRGDRFFCKKILNFLWEKSFGPGDLDEKKPLTDREVEIVRLVSRGKTTREISRVLQLSPHTVYTHRKNIMRKLSLGTTPELVLYAVNQGIVRADSF